MIEHFGEFFKRKMVENKILAQDRIEGCTAAEIEAVMQAQKVSHLPKIFREYLETMGKKGLGYNPYMGASWNCNALKLQKGWMQKSLKDRSSSLIVPPDAFVFYDQGEDTYRYFLTADKLEDPPIYQITISKELKTRSHESLSTYFDDILTYYLRHNPASNRTKPVRTRRSRLNRLEESTSRRDAFLKGLVNQIFGKSTED